MNSQVLRHKDSIRLLGVEILQALVWHEHDVSLVTDTGKRLGFRFRMREQLSPSNLGTIYRAQIWLGLGYYSNIWDAAAPFAFTLFDSIKKWYIRLIGDPLPY